VTRVDEAASSELVLLEDAGGYAVISFNRPEKRNAMNAPAQAAFRAAMFAARDKKVVVLTGVGSAFCSGVDLTERADLDPAGGRKLSQELAGWLQCQEDISRHPAVFIAAVNGFALGGGSTLVNNCELAIAAESAEIGTPEMGFGVWPGQAGPAMIKRLLPKHAAEIIFNAKRVDAATAFRMGMVNEVVPDAELMTRAAAMAAHIAQFDAEVLDWGKKAYRQMLSLDWAQAMDYSTLTNIAIARFRAGPNEARAAFAEGRRGPGQGR
jgi:enoyl-CoA hydratase/carnithine racemase